MKKNLKIEMTETYVNLYGINKKLDKLCVYMVHLLISKKLWSVHSCPSDKLRILNKFINKLDLGQQRLFEDIVLEETLVFNGPRGVVAIMSGTGLEKDLFENSSKFSSWFRIKLFEAQDGRCWSYYYKGLKRFRPLFIECSADEKCVKELLRILQYRVYMHAVYADEYYFFIEELLCELVDCFHHDENFTCRTTHQNFLKEDTLLYPPAIKALINFLLWLSTFRTLNEQRKSAESLKSRLKELGWTFAENNF